MTGFMLAAVLGVALVLLLLLRPFFWRTGAAGASQRQLNAAICRDQLAKLEQDLADGTLGVEDYEPARADLQRRMLQDTAQEDAAPTLGAPKRTLAAVALALPLAAFGLYFSIGRPDSMTAAAPTQAGSRQDVEKMVAGLAARLEKEPGNLKGWAMLARSYKLMGRPVEAERAFDRAGAFLDDDAQLLADYADVAATNAGGSFAGKPTRLIDKALQAEPANPMALWLAGRAAMNSGQFDKALATWGRLMKQLPPGSEDARMLQGAIDEIRAQAGNNVQRPAAAQADDRAKPAAVAQGGSVSGTVELAPSLVGKAQADATVMVIARVPGSRMPVAVLRVRGAKLPLQFTLDDTLAMSPQALISSASEVEVEARISKSGLAKPEPGDLVSAVQTIKVGTRGVKLNVAEVRP